MGRKKSSPQTAVEISSTLALSSEARSDHPAGRYRRNLSIYRDWYWHLGLFSDAEKNALREHFAPADRLYGDGNDGENFLNLLSVSLSLSKQEKQRVLRALADDTLSAFQIKELEKVFTDELVEFDKLLETEGMVIVGLFARCVIDWVQILLPKPLALVKLQQIARERKKEVIASVFQRHSKGVHATWATIGLAALIAPEYFENIGDEDTAEYVLNTLVRYELEPKRRADVSYRRTVEEMVFSQTSQEHQKNAFWFRRRVAWHYFYEDRTDDALAMIDEVIASTSGSMRDASIRTALDLYTYAGTIESLVQKPWFRGLSRDEILANHAVQAPLEAAGEGGISGRLLYEIFLLRKDRRDSLEEKKKVIHTCVDLLLEMARQGADFSANCKINTPHEQLKNEVALCALEGFRSLSEHEGDSFFDKAFSPTSIEQNSRREFLTVYLQWAVTKALLPSSDAAIISLYLQVKNLWDKRISDFREKCWDRLEAAGESNFLFDLARTIEGNEKRGKRLAQSLKNGMERQNAILYLVSCAASSNEPTRKAVSETLTFLLSNSEAYVRLDKLPGPPMRKDLLSLVNKDRFARASNSPTGDIWKGTLPLNSLRLVGETEKKAATPKTRKKKSIDTD